MPDNPDPRAPGTPPDGTLLRPAPAGTQVRPATEPAATVTRAPTVPTAPAPEAAGETLLRPAPRARAAEPRAGVAEGATVQRRFVLTSMIGAGAMGQVWRARDLIREQARNPNPYVALKLLNADSAQHPDAFVGLEREASKAQKLAHPNVITVYDFDFDPDLQRAFMSMELLDGRPLEDVIKRARGSGVTRAEALPIIDGVTDGLAYAHRRHVVHCDLKPGNIFVTGEGVPKILDFGIARAARGTGSSTSDDDGFQGYTPAYASAELIANEDPDPADDVYSLGVLLYELLSGRHPFAGASADVAKAKGLVPVPLKDLKAREWRAIARALAFERKGRFADAAAFRRAFQGTSALPKVLGALALVLALAAGVFWYRGWRAEQPDLPLAELPAATQQAFAQEAGDGDRAWELVQAGQTFLINDALEHYGNAYDLHPRDARAVAGLKRAADYAIDKLLAAPDKDAAIAQLEDLERKNAFLKGYKPLVRAVETLKAR
jgi:hypothetical protein